jgi:RNA polymerase sigma-70 factor (ECF subfamily)
MPNPRSGGSADPERHWAKPSANALLNSSTEPSANVSANCALKRSASPSSRAVTTASEQGMNPTPDAWASRPFSRRPKSSQRSPPLPHASASPNMRISFVDRALPRMPDTSFIDPDQSASAANNAGASALNQLLVQVARGDRAAFESLYRATSSKLFGICLRVLPDRADAEEVLQDVFTGIWNKAGQFDPERASAIAWLAMVARNKAIDRLRSQPARGTMASIELAEEVADAGPSPLRATEAADDRSRLEACIGQLEPKRRALIRAAFFEGSTYEELAQRSASPLGSVKSWIRRGLLQLRGCLES